MKETLVHQKQWQYVLHLSCRVTFCTFEISEHTRYTRFFVIQLWQGLRRTSRHTPGMGFAAGAAASDACHSWKLPSTRPPSGFASLADPAASCRCRPPAPAPADPNIASSRASARRSSKATGCCRERGTCTRHVQVSACAPQPYPTYPALLYPNSECEELHTSLASTELSTPGCWCEWLRACMHIYAGRF